MELIPKRGRLRAANKQMLYGLAIRGTERAERGSNLFHFVIVDEDRKYKPDAEKMVQKNESLALKEVMKLLAS